MVNSTTETNELDAAQITAYEAGLRAHRAFSTEATASAYEDRDAWSAAELAELHAEIGNDHNAMGKAGLSNEQIGLAQAAHWEAAEAFEILDIIQQELS